MAGELHAVAVRLVDRGGELGRRDVHIGLGRGEAERGPVAHRRARLGRVAQRMELGMRRRRAFEIGRGEIEIGADQPPRLDLPPDAEIAVGIHRAGGARGGDAAGEIERRGRSEHLVADERAVARGRAEHMLVHADQAGDDRLAAAVDLARAGRDASPSRPRRSRRCGHDRSGGSGSPAPARRCRRRRVTCSIAISGPRSRSGSGPRRGGCARARQRREQAGEKREAVKRVDRGSPSSASTAAAAAATARPAPAGPRGQAIAQGQPGRRRPEQQRRRRSGRGRGADRSASAIRATPARARASAWKSLRSNGLRPSLIWSSIVAA